MFQRGTVTTELFVVLQATTSEVAHGHNVYYLHFTLSEKITTHHYNLCLSLPDDDISNINVWKKSSNRNVL